MASFTITLEKSVVSLYTSIPHDLGIDALTYWIEKYPQLIPSRFTKEFILEASLFILSNNYFIFDDECWLQLIGAAMGTNFSSPYACLTVGFLEETKLYQTILPLHFTHEECSIIIQLFSRFVDDGFIIWPVHLDRNTFENVLQILHPSIKFTIEGGKKELKDGEMIEKLNFLDITVILHESGKIETDIFYKTTNSHDYLNYNSHHPSHTKKNMIYNLAKRIITFVSDPILEEKRLYELKEWLIKCNYPIKSIEKGIHNSRLQGPANNPQLKQRTIPFITMHTSNMDCSNTVKLCNDLLTNTRDDQLKHTFKDSKVVLALKQPRNLLMQLTKAKFLTEEEPQKENGLFKCNGKRCQICKLYLQVCKSFIGSNNIEWIIRSHITCNSEYVNYYLACLCCNKETYTGKTFNLRERTNQHISSCRTGRTSNKFDLHVFNCRQRHNVEKEPYFKLYVFLEVSDPNLLLTYESYLHAMKFDTMN